MGAQFEAELQQELDALERREAAARRAEVRLRRFEPEPGGRDAGAAGPSAAGAKRRLAAWRRMLQERGMDETLRAASAGLAEHRATAQALRERLARANARTEAECTRHDHTRRSRAARVLLAHRPGSRREPACRRPQAAAYRVAQPLPQYCLDVAGAGAARRA